MPKSAKKAIKVVNSKEKDESLISLAELAVKTVQKIKLQVMNVFSLKITYPKFNFDKIIFLLMVIRFLKVFSNFKANRSSPEEDIAPSRGFSGINPKPS